MADWIWPTDHGFHPRFKLFTYTVSGKGKARMSMVGRVYGYMGVIIYSFNLNISSKMSCGVFECDIFMLQNYMLMIL